MARQEISDARRDGAPVTLTEIVARVEARLMALQRPRLTPIVNGTGVILHTNLGRHRSATRRPPQWPPPPRTCRWRSSPTRIYAAVGCGRSRTDALLCGAERTLVVNNNAAALLVSLAGLAGGREVIVSRERPSRSAAGFESRT
jgi:L-seryl-tRNA(Ser) seleniumtransferase